MATTSLADYRSKTPEELAQLDINDLFDEYIYADALSNKGTLSKALSRPYFEAITAELTNRGYTEDMIQDEAGVRRQMIAESSFGDLTTDAAVNYRFLADVNGTREELIYRYMHLSEAERELTSRFKSDLDAETQGVAAGSRWDEDLDSDEGSHTMNAGTDYEVTVHHNDDGTYHCESEYLGTFDYDPNDWAVGYKTVPGDSSLQIPVFKYIGDVQADAGHAAGFEEGFNLNPFGNGGLSGINRNEQVHIPDGVRVLDYTFDGNTELQLIPGIPDSVVSAHCAFRNCTRLHGGSHELKEGESAFDNSGGHWSFGDEFEDASSMFYGCSELGNVYIGKLPESLLTINGMFAGCPQVFEENFTGVDSLAHQISTLGRDGYTEADYSDCMYLEEEFANPVDAETSNKFKKNAQREFEELMQTHSEYDWTEASEEDREKHEDAVAANTAVRTEKVLDAEVTVRDLDETYYEEPESNQLLYWMQRGAIDVGSFAILKGITGAVTGNKLAGWAAGLGGTALLRYTNILPESFEPILKMVKPLLPESAQTAIDSLCEKLHVPSKEDIAKAKEEQFARYVPLALGDSMSRSVKSAGGVTTNSLVEAMRVNGRVIGSNDVLVHVGQAGPQDAESIGTLVQGSTAAAEDAFDKRIAEGENCNEIMRLYYTDLFAGLNGYNKGAIDGINATYEQGSSEQITAMQGLGYINSAYYDAAMESLRNYDNQYHFMTQADWDVINGYGFTGVNDGTTKQMGTTIPTTTPTAKTNDLTSASISEEKKAARLRQAEGVSENIQMNSDEDTYDIHSLSR